MRRLTPLIPSILFVAAAAYAVDALALLQPGQFAVAKFSPLLIAGTGLALSFHFNRSRIFFQLIAVAGAYGFLLWGPSAANGSPYAAAAILLPLNLLFFSFLKERGIATPVGLGRLGLILLQGGLVLLLPRIGDPSLLAWLQFKFVKESLIASLILPQPALAAVGISAAGLLAHFAWKPGAQTAGLIGAVAAGAAMFHFSASETALVAFGAAATLVLMISVVQESYSMAYIDELTCLPGRRALQEAMLKLGSRYAVAMLDVDHFKKFNDTYGHDVGDEVLRMVASRIKGVSAGGRAFRYGGEEFTILFPGKAVEEVLPALDEVRARVESSGFMLRNRDRRQGASARGAGKGGKRVAVTISIGVAGKGSGDKLESGEVIKTADEALYRAKSGGRNRVSR